MTSMMNSKIERRREEIARKLKTSFSYYAPRCLKVKTMDRGLVPFDFKFAQKYAYKEIVEQRRRIGKIRKIIVKARKEGISTLVEGFYYHGATQNANTDVFILSHDGKTTSELFNMTKRFHRNIPEPMRQPTQHNNQQTLFFSALDSSFGVGTAGNTEIGRGRTPHLFHGSEVASWLKGDELMSGILAAVPSGRGSSIILESTAKGMGGIFYELTTQAVKGDGEFEVIFIPWFWEPTYSTPVPGNYNLVFTEEEKELVGLYNLTREQVYWRRNAIFGFRGKLELFKQEYPANLMEAFQSTGNPFIKNELIMRARKSTYWSTSDPVIAGVDPGRTSDRTVIVLRQGRKILETFCYETMDEMRLASILAHLLMNYRAPNSWAPISQVFIDHGQGCGTYDRLVQLGYGSQVTKIHFNNTARDSETYANIRAEMFDKVYNWFYDGCDIPDRDDFHAEMTAVPMHEGGGETKIRFMKKKDIKKLFGRSTDFFDALALTFAREVTSILIQQETGVIMKQSRKIKTRTSNYKRINRPHEKQESRYTGRRLDLS